MWLGNSRGNKYSRYHETLKPEEEQFWDYSFHEMGIYDTPACLDYIIKTNPSSNKIIYFGHSQGGCMIFAGMSIKPEYFQERLLLVVALAPASQLNHISSDLLHGINKYLVYDFLKDNKIYEVLPFDKKLIKLGTDLMKRYPVFSYSMMEYLTDQETLTNCPERIIVYLNRYPSGTSLKSLEHFRHVIASKTFTFYDYGDKNLEKYGSETPPIYDLSKIRGIPVVLCGGLNDRLTHIDDIRWLRDQIKHVLMDYNEYKYFGHASFLLSNDITWFNDVLRNIYKIIK